MTRAAGAVMGLAAAILAMAAWAPAMAAPAWEPPRTAWGDPDLRGVWPLNSVGRTPLQRPERFGERGMMTDEEYEAAKTAASNAFKGYEREDSQDKMGNGHWLEPADVEPLRQTSLITEPSNGRIPPMTEAGKARAAGMRSSWSQGAFDSLADFNPLDRCITRGLPASMLPFPYNNGVRIFQAPGHVVLQLEIVHETRIIPLDGRPPLPGQIRPWLGSSRGRFEGNTLVIETTNFNGESPMIIVGPGTQPIPTSKSMRIVERLTPTGPDTLQYEAQVEDPESITGPWKMSFPWRRNDAYEIFEYACHEGNTVVPYYIRSTSPRFAAERAKAEAAAAAAAGPAPSGR